MLLYRREVRRLMDEEGAIDFLTGTFDEFERIFLDEFCVRWKIPPDAAEQIEKEVTEPFRNLHQKLRKYEELYQKALKRGFPFSGRIRQRLQDCQKLWGLRDADITPIVARLQPASTVISPSEPSPTSASDQQDASNSPQSGVPEVPARYRQLEQFLQAQEWQRADEETGRQMLQVANRAEEGWLDLDDIDNFPCEDLRAIDRLWVHYSQGRFGFSVQKRLYQSLGGTQQYAQGIWQAFGDAVGWRVRGAWLYYSDLNFSVNAPGGHLPVGGSWGVSSLASRLVDCNI